MNMIALKIGKSIYDCISSFFLLYLDNYPYLKNSQSLAYLLLLLLHMDTHRSKDWHLVSLMQQSLPFLSKRIAGHYTYLWMHFQCHRNRANCLLCNKTYAYNGGTTSNLISHLERKHPSNTKHEEGHQANNSRQLSIGDFAKLAEVSNV